MKIFWIALAILCVLMLGIVMLVQNASRSVYNLFHRTKRLISWDPMEPRYDITESFYHDQK